MGSTNMFSFKLQVNLCKQALLASNVLMCLVEGLKVSRKKTQSQSQTQSGASETVAISLIVACVFVGVFAFIFLTVDSVKRSNKSRKNASDSRSANSKDGITGTGEASNEGYGATNTTTTTGDDVDVEEKEAGYAAEGEHNTEEPADSEVAVGRPPQFCGNVVINNAVQKTPTASFAEQYKLSKSISGMSEPVVAVSPSPADVSRFVSGAYDGDTYSIENSPE